MGTARRKFTKQYKADAVQLYQDSGLTMGQVARQLGIGESTLQSWGPATWSPQGWPRATATSPASAPAPPAGVA